jgi:hypothetical protein
MIQCQGHGFMPLLELDFCFMTSGLRATDQ